MSVTHRCCPDDCEPATLTISPPIPSVLMDQLTILAPWRGPLVTSPTNSITKERNLIRLEQAPTITGMSFRGLGPELEAPTGTL